MSLFNKARYMRKYYRENKRKIHDKNLKYYQDNKERIKRDTKAYRLKHLKRAKEYALEYNYEKFGWTPKWHAVQVKKYKNLCAICLRKKRLCVDHKKRVRGRLCDNCNRMLGHAKDNATTLRRAALYVQRHK